MTAASYPWHAILTLPRAEFAVAAALTDLDLISYCPRHLLTWETHRHKRREILVPYLATWVFARWDSADPRLWHQIHDLTGVRAFIGGADPAPIPDREITRLRDRIGDDDRIIHAEPAPFPIYPGRLVRLTDGPFQGHLGLVSWVNRQRTYAKVEITYLHDRLVPIDCATIWLEPAEPTLGRSDRELGLPSRPSRFDDRETRTAAPSAPTAPGARRKRRGRRRGPPTIGPQRRFPGESKPVTGARQTVPA